MGNSRSIDPFELVMRLYCLDVNSLATTMSGTCEFRNICILPTIDDNSKMLITSKITLWQNTEYTYTYICVHTYLYNV